MLKGGWNHDSRSTKDKIVDNSEFSFDTKIGSNHVSFWPVVGCDAVAEGLKNGVLFGGFLYLGQWDRFGSSILSDVLDIFFSRVTSQWHLVGEW